MHKINVVESNLWEIFGIFMASEHPFYSGKVMIEHVLIRGYKGWV